MIGLRVHGNNEWRWASDNLQIWAGLANGHATNGAYTQWQGGEPNGGSGREECVQFYSVRGAARDCPFACAGLDSSPCHDVSNLFPPWQGHSGNWNDCGCSGRYVCQLPG